MDFANMDLTKKLKLISAIVETILALAWLWSIASIVFLIMHGATLFFSIKNNAPRMGSIAWIFINIIWWMPLAWVVGRSFHLVTAILCWFDYSRMKSMDNQEVKKVNEFIER